MPSSSSSSSSLEEAFSLFDIATKLEEEASANNNHANKKNEQISTNKKKEAVSNYLQACSLLQTYVNSMPSSAPSSSSSSSLPPSASMKNDNVKELLMEKIKHYQSHAMELMSSSSSSPRSTPSESASVTAQFGKKVSAPHHDIAKHENIMMSKSNIHRNDHENENAALVTEKAGRANDHLRRAIDLDEQGNTEKSMAEYMVSADLFLQALKAAQDGGDGEEDVVASLKRRLEGIMDRVEVLKSPNRQNLKPQVAPPIAAENKSSLSPTEIAVLKRSSMIASGLFMPWSDDEIQTFDFGSTTAWKDPDGPLKLSSSQKKLFYKWARPTEIIAMRQRHRLVDHHNHNDNNVVMVKHITPYTIRQKAVTDCSFIASLCICASFERRFRRKLITSIIYPQKKKHNPKQSQAPIVNPYGKYVVKLWLNGVARRVVVDDYLPVDKRGNLLCSHTLLEGDDKGILELWVPIIEKAYMKLCGGYDFPGSNSGVDLFSLTGWIPERIFFPKHKNDNDNDNNHNNKESKVKDFETPSERAWERLHRANAFGDCLITTSTGSNISEQQAESIGLVTGHAYAVLSVVQTSNHIRLLQLKNPWAHQSWKGKYSRHDVQSWNNDATLRKEVGYKAKQQHGDKDDDDDDDDGVFWISWEDVLIYFRNLHLSWNPSLFRSQIVTHAYWPKTQGPTDDSYNMTENPQYILTLSQEAISKRASVWILLSRHVTKQEQEGDSTSTDFLTVHVYRNKSSQHSIRYPNGDSSPRICMGAYTNSPHVLIRYDIVGSEDKYLSLVLSQYKKKNDLGYTLSCYCTSDIMSMGTPIKTPPHVTKLTEQWTEHTAGGPPVSGIIRDSDPFYTNPMWIVSVPKTSEEQGGGGTFVQIQCSAVKTLFINIMLVKIKPTNKKGDEGGNHRFVKSDLWKREHDVVIDTGDYRQGFVSTNVEFLEAGMYILVASTYLTPLGAFVINFYSATRSISMNAVSSVV